jgi:very-short-patch-repair endonuclease
MPKKTMKVNLKNKTKRTDPEDMMAKQLREAGFKGYRRNARFIPGRRYEADFWFPRLKLAIEVDGGLWMPRGGHTSGSGAKRDRERDMLAYLADGILTWRVASDHVKSGEAIAWIVEAMKRREQEIGRLT